MPTIVITAEAENAIRSAAEGEFYQTGVRLPDGNFTVPVGDDTLAAIQKESIPGETVSDTIIRVIRRHNGLKPS